MGVCLPLKGREDAGREATISVLHEADAECSQTAQPGHLKMPLFLTWALLPKVKVQSLSRVQLFATPWTVAHQAPPSMGFSRQEYWSGLPFPTPGDLPNPGIEPTSLMSPALTGELFTTSARPGGT